MRGRVGAVVAIALVAVLAACGDDDDTTPQAATTSPPSTALLVTEPPVTTAAPPTTPAPSTVPPTTAPATSAPATTAPATTAPATSAAPIATGWVDSRFVPAAAVQGYSGNWWGESGPSPAAPADGEMPADGYYVATVLEPWSPEDPDHLSVRIQRLEWCKDLPDRCEYIDEEVDEMNLDPTWQLDVDVPLDATTDVVVQGYKCSDAPEQKTATGVELADLFDAFTKDYEAFVAPQLGSDTAGYDVAMEIAADPQGGFESEAVMCPTEPGMAGPLRYVHDDAPVLLLQTVTDWDGGPLDATDLIMLNGVQFTDGVPLFYFYAGFYS